MPRKHTMHTIYHVMDAAGLFDTNPANSGARDQDGMSLYEGPREFPKMLYHPEGKTRVIVPAEIIVTPLGPKAVGEQREIISQIVQNPSQEEKLLSAGWHRRPAQAMLAAGLEAPPSSTEELIQDKDAEIIRLKRELAEARGEELPVVAHPAPSMTISRHQ